MAARYVLGIDLGTTNSVLAYAALEAETPEVRLLDIPQLTAPATVESRPSLASFLYLASEHDVSGQPLRLPWNEGADFAVGEMARSQAAEQPQRTVGAAKSWLGHSKVDRHQPMLPWDAPAEVGKVSPVEASTRYLRHLADAWRGQFPDDPISDQQVVLTVPASFDASARELTREAARAASLPDDLVLLEEPQAAVYAWLDDAGDAWRQEMQVGDRLLVCDVGGGTTDLTLIRAEEESGELVLSRMAVGNHLLVGGDNMDLALAHLVAGQFAEQGTQLDAWQSVSLWHACRAAKETLLAPEGPENHTISVLGRGSKLIGGTVSVEVDRRQVRELLVEGFLPACQADDRPERRRTSGFQQIGLPFETDTGITRHLAEFLGTHAGEGEAAVRPTHVLFNGGVFKGEALRERVMGVLASWFVNEQLPRQLAGRHDLDFAVARGAAHYGWTKCRGGLRIRGGTARAYYVGIETAGLAVPGAPRPLQALCVVPIGMEEGTTADVPSNEIGLVVGEPAHFRFFSSSVRKQDQPGHLLAHWSDQEVTETDSLEMLLPADETIDEPYVPVRFHTCVTELGALELWCVSTTSEQRWKLEFSVREDA